MRRLVIVAISLFLLGSLGPAPSASAASAAWSPPASQMVPNGQPDPNCPSGSTCPTGVTIKCYWGGTWRSQRAWYAERIDGFNATTNPPRGVAVFFSGGNGKGYTWGSGEASPQLFTDLKDHGIHVVQARWHNNWMLATSGDTAAGLGNLGCRPATLVQWVYQQVFVNRFHLDLVPRTTGECGFCIIGTSYGTDQVAYPLSHYGKASIVDGAFYASGPTHANLVKACSRTPNYQFDQLHRKDIDKTYGILTGNGPCYRFDTSPIWTSTRWPQDSVALGGLHRDFPETRVHIILGAVDSKGIHNHAREWENVLEANGGGACDFNRTGEAIGDRCYEDVVPGMGHAIRDSLEGLRRLANGLIWPQTL